MDPTLSFQLDEENVKLMKAKYPNPFEGKPSISAFTFMRTYSRNIYDTVGNYLKNESFFDVCLRCVNGCMSLAKDKLGDSWDNDYWTKHAVQMLELFLQFKLLPSGRNLWALGTELVHTKRIGLALFNCTFITSKNIDVVKAEFFCYIMDALMLGAGVGYDAKGAGLLKIQRPEPAPHQRAHPVSHIEKHIKEMLISSKKRDPSGIPYLKYELEYIKNITSTHRNNYCVHTVVDTREGWVNALRILLNSYLGKEYLTIFDYSRVRPAGIPLKMFGGMSSGPQPLAEGLSIIRHLLNSHTEFDSILIADIANILAMVVVSGNVRRSSQIFVFDDPEMCEIKNWQNEKYKYRTMAEGWAYNSNNSFTVTDSLSDTEYSALLDKFIPLMNMNGEPGIFGLDACRKYGRILDGETNCDTRIDGVNPCGEIPLEGTSDIASDKPNGAGGELCNLTEIIMPNINSLDEFIHVARYATFLAKMVATVPIHWKATHEIQQRNFRLGVSQTGIIEFLAKIDYNMTQYAQWLDTCYRKIRDYDVELSKLFGLPQSIKLTTIKPSGTLSLVAGVSSGMHPIRALYFIRRIRIAKNKTDLIEILRAHGIHIEDDVHQANTTVVASFPMKYEKGIKTKEQFSFVQQAELHKLLQHYWADNSVSCTLEFREDEIDDLKNYLLENKKTLKGAAVLPVRNYTYPQLPQETITEEQYNEMIANFKPFTDKVFLTGEEQDEEELDNYCSGEHCMRR